MDRRCLSGKDWGFSMLGSPFRFAAAAIFCLQLAACASGPDSSRYGENGTLPAPMVHGTRIETPDKPMQCVPYARARSGVTLFGDAGTWWAKADGIYARGTTPRLGAVIVLTGYAGPGRGHVGVVSALLSDREIRIDHANWLDDGAIYVSDPVVDVSPDNDWSEVRVYNPRTGSWGIKTYIVQGFIGPGHDGDSDRVASD
jgi:surface antigen